MLAHSYNLERSAIITFFFLMQAADIAEKEKLLVDYVSLCGQDFQWFGKESHRRTLIGTLV